MTSKLQAALDTAILEDLVGRYQELVADGLASNLHRRTATASDARRIARRFRNFEDLILDSPPVLTWIFSQTMKRRCDTRSHVVSGLPGRRAV